MTDSTSRHLVFTAARNHVSAAVNHLRGVLNGKCPSPPHAYEWMRRELLFADSQLCSLDTYAPCLEAFNSDPSISDHLDRMVGTDWQRSRFEAKDLLRSLVVEMLEDSGDLAYSEDRFKARWEQWMAAFDSSSVKHVAIAPIAGLRGIPHAIEIAPHLVLDKLSDEEILTCVQHGVLDPVLPEMPLVGFEGLLGFRLTVEAPKVISVDGSLSPIVSPDESGTFGHRPWRQVGLAVDDAVMVLRLLKRSRVRCLGHVLQGSSPFVRGIQWQRRLVRNSGGSSTLDAAEAAEVPAILGQLLDQERTMSFSLRRFSQSCERENLEDRFVDLVIAAEAFYLADVDSGRGELTFRIAHRAARFLAGEVYSAQRVYELMKAAYGVRSKVVHGSALEKISKVLPSGVVSLEAFADVLEDLLRLGFRRALESRPDRRKATYWEKLLLS